MTKFYFNIDVLGFGACNLTCPSCPVGNMPDAPNPKGLMEPALLQAILDKAARECDLEGVALFNWTEPMLHPRLPELVRIVRSFNIRCDLSSNLNKLKNIDAILGADPTSFRISNSGFTQEVYELGHRGGNINLVKANMIELAAAKKRTSSSTELHLLYHRYSHNLDEEVRMNNFCSELGIGFIPVWAFMMPLEKLMAHLDRDVSSTTITSDDTALMGRLLLPVDEALAAAQAHRRKPCTLQTQQMTLDFQGNVQLCCATYDSSRFTLGAYLDISLADLQSTKARDKTCARCIKHGIHVYYTYAAPEFEEIARRHAAEHQHPVLDATPAVRT
ncbi:MAG: radical SAM protein [Candidatus Sumerlaeaceae bacterium]